MLNIVIPMAGRGSRFSNAGYTLPKPLIAVYEKPMIEAVINNLRPSQKHRFIFLCLKEHLENYKIDEWLARITSGCEIVTVDTVTEGAACTVLLAKEFINSEDALMIANCDQLVDINIDTYLNELDKKELDGLIMTMTANDPKWSFVRFNDKGYVCEVVEKRVVSNEATVGIYNYKQGSYFVNAAETMIKKGLRVNNEFYVAPAYNEMIEDGMKIGTYNIGTDFKGMYGLGTPEDLEMFLSHKDLRRLVVK